MTTVTVIINGHTYTSDADKVTGLAGGGHRKRLLPLINDVAIVAAGVAQDAQDTAEHAVAVAQIVQQLNLTGVITADGVRSLTLGVLPSGSDTALTAATNLITALVNLQAQALAAKNAAAAAALGAQRAYAVLELSGNTVVSSAHNGVLLKLGSNLTLEIPADLKDEKNSNNFCCAVRTTSSVTFSPAAGVTLKVQGENATGTVTKTSGTENKVLFGLLQIGPNEFEII